MSSTIMKKELTKKELATSNKYWFEEFCQKSKQVDKLCVKSAERLGQIDYRLWKDGVDICHEKRAALLVEKTVLEDVIKHFIGFVDLEYITGHDLSPESIERNKTRKDRQ